LIEIILKKIFEDLLMKNAVVEYIQEKKLVRKCYFELI